MRNAIKMITIMEDLALDPNPTAAVNIESMTNPQMDAPPFRIPVT